MAERLDSSGRARRRVLIGAYACDPEEGSEPGVGWHWALQAARHGEVHVITRSNNRAAIERHLPGHHGPQPEFHYIDLPRPLRWLKKRTGTYGLIAYYYLWQIMLAIHARRLHRLHRYDLCHHVTFANDWLPSGLALLKKVPFVWGPVGGSTHRAPPEVEQGWLPDQQRYEKTRRLVQNFMIKLDPLLRLTARRATLTLPYTREAAAAPHLKGRRRVVTHIGMEPAGSVDTGRPMGGPLHLVTGGRLVHWKGHDLILEALGSLSAEDHEPVRLTITGNGPARPQLEGLAGDLGITGQVEFVGYLPTQSDVVDLVRSAHLYVLPTWRDGPPVAILEAMSVGTPPLCLSLGATDELVPEGTGLKVDPIPFATVADRIAQAIQWACSHRSELGEMGTSSAEHVRRHHDWQEIGVTIGEVYEEAASSGSGIRVSD